MNWHNCHRQQRRLNPLPMASTLYQSHLAAQLVATTMRIAVAAELDPPLKMLDDQKAINERGWQSEGQSLDHLT